MKRVLIVTDTHYCQLEYGGITKEEKAERIVAQINAEYEKEPFELILFLGDYSLDHWAWNTKGTWLTHGKSYTAEFKDKYLGALPAPYYMLPGNHEQYGEENWRALTGFSREAEFVCGDILFILWDSYGGQLDPDFHSDGTYTAPDVKRIREIMERYPDKKVILCSHYFLPCGSEEEKELIREERVICLVQGHTHSSKILTLPQEYGSKLVLQAGAWIASPIDKEAWGVRDLCIFEDKIISRYIVADHTLYHNGEAYEILAHYRDGVEIKI